MKHIFCFTIIMFGLQARDLLCWAKEVETEMVVDKCVRDVVGVDLLCVRHDEVRAEIEARQDTFVDVLDTGKVLLSNKHYASDDVCVQFLIAFFDVYLSRCRSYYLFISFCFVFHCSEWFI